MHPLNIHTSTQQKQDVVHWTVCCTYFEGGQTDVCVRACVRGAHVKHAAFMTRKAASSDKQEQITQMGEPSIHVYPSSCTIMSLASDL